MSIATAACAFCVSQTANAAEKSVTTVESAVATTKSSTPPPVANSNFTNTDTSKESSLKTEDSSNNGKDSGISENGGSKIAESTKGNVKTEVSSEAGTQVKTETGTNVKSESKPETGTNVKSESKYEPEAAGKPDVKPEPKTKADTNPEFKHETTEKPGANSETSTTNTQMLLATAAKPTPKQTPATQTTELKITFQWGEMNDENTKEKKSRLVKADSDFGRVSTIWSWGTDRKSGRKDVETAFEGIEYTIFDNTDKKVVGDGIKGSIPKDSIETSVSLGRFDYSHTYTVSVVNGTVPNPYFVTYNASTDDGKEFKPNIDSFTWEPSKGTNKDSQKKCIRLDVLEIVYAKDEDVAKDCFSYTQPKGADDKPVSEGNWNFKYNNDNIFARLRVKDNVIQFPTTNPTKDGYTFAGWQYYVAKKTNGKPYTSFDRMFDDDQTIIKNTTPGYEAFDSSTTKYPYKFALIRDNKSVNVYEDKCGTQYGLVSHTFVVFPKWIKETGYKVTFINEGNTYATVKVEKDKSISDKSVEGQSMPANPSKDWFTFEGWNEKQDGTGAVFNDSTKVSSDLTVYSIFKDYPPVITVQNKTITEGDSLDLNSLVVSATDKEDGDLKSSVQRTNNGGFDNTKVGSYNVTFSVTDKGGATATAAATVTVTKKPTPPTPPAPAPTPTPEPEPEPEPEPTPTPEPEPDIDWDDIPDIDLTPDQEPEPNPVPVPVPVPVPDFPVPVAPAPILPPAEAEPEPAPAPAPSQPEQPEQQAKHDVKHLPKTGSTATPILASAIASLFAGLAGLAESFAANRKRRN